MKKKPMGQVLHTKALPYIFELVCNQHQIEHRKTKMNRPWTNRQVKRMNRALKYPTVKTFHYASHCELKAASAFLFNGL